MSRGMSVGMCEERENMKATQSKTLSVEYKAGESPRRSACCTETQRQRQRQ